MDNVTSLYNDLVWQVESGADEALDEQPGLIHWKGRAAKASPQTLQPIEKTAGIPLTVSSSATTLEALKKELIGFDGCALKQTAMNLVFSDGNPNAKIMCIGDAPGEDDDRSGKPFSGAAGQLFDEMMAAIGLSRDTLYLTNLIFWRPPGNRTPSEIEVAACLPFTERHIALIKPDVLIVMGQIAMRSLLRTKDTFAKRRGQWSRYAPALGTTDFAEGASCLPLYHPSHLMRQPASKRQMWADLLALSKEINSVI